MKPNDFMSQTNQSMQESIEFAINIRENRNFIIMLGLRTYIYYRYR